MNEIYVNLGVKTCFKDKHEPDEEGTWVAYKIMTPGGWGSEDCYGILQGKYAEVQLYALGVMKADGIVKFPSIIRVPTK